MASFQSLLKSLVNLSSIKCPNVAGSIKMVYQKYLYTYFSNAVYAIKTKLMWTTIIEAIARDRRANIVFYQSKRETVLKMKHLLY